MWTKTLKKLYQKSKVLVNQMAVAAIPLVILEEETRSATSIIRDLIDLVAMIGGLYLLYDVFWGKTSISKSEGWNSITRPIQMFAGAALALFFALDLIGVSVLGDRLGNLLLDLLK